MHQTQIRNPFNLIVLILFSLLAGTCKSGKEDDLNQTLMLLFMSEQESSLADLVFERGFPGSNNLVEGTFTGDASDYSVTINGVAAGGITLSGGLQFTMPLLAGVSENTTVPMVILKDGAEVMNKTVRYRPLLTVVPGQPNSLNPAVLKYDDSVYFTFAAGTHTVSSQLTSIQTAYPEYVAEGYAQDFSDSHLINIFGYSGANLQLHSLVSANDPFIELADRGLSNLNFKKARFSGNPIIRVRYAGGNTLGGGTTFRFRINVASGHILAASSTDYNYPGWGLIGCYEFQGSGSAADPANFCATRNPGMTRVARCTYASENGITTRSYYNTGFGQNDAVTSCVIPGNGSYNEMEAIAEDD